MSLQSQLEGVRPILTGGAVIERLRRDPDVELDPYLVNSGLALDEGGRARLRPIYREYLDIGARHELPMIACAPTWRASAERCARAGYSHRQVNGTAVDLLLGIRDEYDAYADDVFLGGLMSCRGDAYAPRDALGPDQAAEHHAPQAAALTDAGVDFIVATTLPAAPEALGLAAAVSATGTPYFLSFIIRPTGTLLDGTHLQDAVQVIDAATDPEPLGYWVNCVHPSVFDAAMTAETPAAPDLGDRLLGLQANTSPLSPEELDGAEDLQTEDPETFARALMAVRARFGTRILGGCCGTGRDHIAWLAQLVAAAR